MAFAKTNLSESHPALFKFYAHYIAKSDEQSTKDEFNTISLDRINTISINATECLSRYITLEDLDRLHDSLLESVYNLAFHNAKLLVSEIKEMTSSHSFFDCLAEEYDDSVAPLKLLEALRADHLLEITDGDFAKYY